MLYQPHSSGTLIPSGGPLEDHLQRVSNPAVTDDTPLYLLLYVGDLEAGMALLHTLHAEVTHLGIRSEDSWEGDTEAAGWELLVCYIYPSPYGGWERRLGDICQEQGTAVPATPVG